MVLEANRPGWGCSGRNGGFARAAIGRHSYSKMLDSWGRETARRVFGQALAAVENLRELMRAGRHRVRRARSGPSEDRAPAESRGGARARSRAAAARVRISRRISRRSAGARRAHRRAAIARRAALSRRDRSASAQARATAFSKWPAQRRRYRAQRVSCPFVVQGRPDARSHDAGRNRARTHRRARDERLHARASARVRRATTLPALSHIIVTRPMTRRKKSRRAVFAPSMCSPIPAICSITGAGCRTTASFSGGAAA